MYIVYNLSLRRKNTLSSVHKHLKLKFHYANFATKSTTKSAEFLRVLPLERHKRICREYVTDFVPTISTCQDNLKAENFSGTFPFYGLRPQPSMKVGIMEFGLKRFETVTRKKL